MGSKLLSPVRGLQNPDCIVCAKKRDTEIHGDLDKLTVGDLVDKILIGHFNLVRPGVSFIRVDEGTSKGL